MHYIYYSLSVYKFSRDTQHVFLASNFNVTSLMRECWTLGESVLIMGSKAVEHTELKVVENPQRRTGGGDDCEGVGGKPLETWMERCRVCRS